MAYSSPQHAPNPQQPSRGRVPWWVWPAGGGVLVAAALGVGVAVVPDTGGQHTGGASASRAAKALVPKKASVGWPPSAVPVTRKQLGKEWPFKLTTRGFVACVKEHPGAIIFNPGDGPELGKPFALNGTALDAGYPDVPKRVWLPDPSVSGARLSVGPLQDRAPNRCQR